MSTCKCVLSSLLEIKVVLKSESLLFWTRIHFKGEPGSPKFKMGGCS